MILTDTVIGFIAGIFVALILISLFVWWKVRSLVNKVRARGQVHEKVQLLMPLISTGIQFAVDTYNTNKRKKARRKRR